MKPLSFKIFSHHVLLCVFLLWAVSDSSTTSTPSTTVRDSKETRMTTTVITSTVTVATTRPPPENVKHVNVLTRTETSITLMWDKVNGSSTYFLKYDYNGAVKEENITVSDEAATVTHLVTPLTAGTKYSFILITESHEVNSTGYKFEAVTMPVDTDKLETLTQTETSITLRWNKVNGTTNYTLVFNGKEENVTASEGPQVTHEISDLTNMTEYNFTLFTVFENIRSRGKNTTAVTAPPNAKGRETLRHTETSITLRWNKVNGILDYTLVFDGKEENVTASEGPQVTHEISNLKSGTKYVFTLFSLFKNVRSSGVNHTAATAPENVKHVNVLTRTETSITLMWDKVNRISTYFLKYDYNGAVKEENITVSDEAATVTYLVTPLTAGTKYSFTLITESNEVNSTGYEYEAVTVPVDTDKLETLTQTETSITLRWNKVNGTTNYTLVFNGKEENVTASEGPQVKHEISDLTNMTEYNFTLFTVFENIRSRGKNTTAVTAPPNAKVSETFTQNETSITLRWNKVNGILDYTLVFDGKEENVTASEGPQVTHEISNLISGTKYVFTLFTLFENVRSSGVNHSAVTAPEDVKHVNVLTQTETNITLQWNKVGDIRDYIILFNGSDLNATALAEPEPVKYTIPNLNSGTKYNFSLFALFEDVRSSGVYYSAATVPSMVTLVTVAERSVTHITLQWNVDVDKDWSYLLKINGEDLYPETHSSVISKKVASLQPGTEYPFTVITMFSELNSTAYKDFTVTGINCATVQWHVTNSSIQGMVNGLFTIATATNKSQAHISTGGSNVSFTGLYPGATYEVSLIYERNSRVYPQCNHSLTIIPPDLSAHCKYWAAGYSVLVAWNEAHGLWTEVEVTVIGRSVRYLIDADSERQMTIDGFQPARTYTLSIASLSGPERRSQPFVFSCPTDPRGVIGGSVFAVLLFIVLVCMAVFIFLKRPDIISRKKQFIGGSKVPNKKGKVISVEKFPDHFSQLSADENRGFSQEYESLSPVGTEQTRKEALLPENKARNRFTNVLPYDWCRVKLTTSDPNVTSDYINASYMPGYSSHREYIASQGPLPSTVNDFWTMIWEQRVKGIVMVTNCTEGGRTKCEQYWPGDSESCHYGELLVTMRSEQQEPNWTLREFRVKHSNKSEERTVKHFHFTAWPDHGVPQGTEVLIQFRGLVRQHIQREGAGTPTVVHCSAGVGRTGTIIALDVLLQQLEKERAVGINAFVHKMRLSRPHMVQTESQYVFLHQCIMDCLQPNDKTEENIYENADMIYANATALREFHKNA
ncbi:receptor-type tyrosine-protein phosphatase H isoform X3 [Dicentrarchus labrax]|uniref:receptor-type tyrosine-protein phosphatase H isoform X3 n=1 Tax=Dicentrarchus labrax TaxID=13489 RepID=UPI0021F5897F|nr:receptor-type tyrosine-protein phosphatase H isoform X3 [Dicentrarchus labrax]